MKKSIKIGGQFSGVGAFDQALLRLNIKYDNIYQAEWDKYARQTYLNNYEEPIYYVKDVNETPINEITKKYGSLDIIMFSPPCQSFSMAGKRAGKEDEKGRGILFFNSLEFIQKNKPRFFIFENVKGLLSHDKNNKDAAIGSTFQEWINYLGCKSVNGLPTIFPYEDAVPYHIYWKVLNAKEHGVPQNRERVFIIGIRDDKDNTFTFPKEEHLTKTLKDVLEEKVDEKYFLKYETIQKLIHYDKRQKENGNGFGAKFHDVNEIMSALKVGGSGVDDLIKLKEEADVWVGDYRADEGFRWREDGNAPTLCTRAREDGSGQPITSDGYKIRRLTPRECFRLMDFPDTFDFSVVSDSQAYKQAGNSIVVRVLEKIISKLPL